MKLASELFAKTISRSCQGDQICHWCGGPCDRQWTHDDVVSLPFSRTKSSARWPSKPHVCVGCWYYRRRSVTVRFLTDAVNKAGNPASRYKDSQSLRHHSWLLTPEGVWGIDDSDSEKLYTFLLRPKVPFALSLLNDKDGNSVENMLHLAVLNTNAEIEGDTELVYTLDNKECRYSPYELEEALKHGTDGKPGGVTLLVNRLGLYTGIPSIDPERKLERGRPKHEKRDRLPGEKIK